MGGAVASTSVAQFPGSAPAPVGPNHDRASASRYLRDTFGLSYSAKTLANLRSTGGGPMFFAGARPLYPQSALDAWGRAKLGPLVASTSEAAALAASNPGQSPR
jgi:hypothetical protein